MSWRYRVLFALRWLKPVVIAELEEKVIDGWVARRLTGRVTVSFDRVGIVIPWFSVTPGLPFKDKVA